MVAGMPIQTLVAVQVNERLPVPVASMTSMPGAGTEISKQALSFTEQNMKAAFEHARKLVHATDLQEAMRIQSEFLRSQFTNAGEHMRQITGGVISAAKDSTKGKY